MGKDLREYLAGTGVLLLALLCCFIPLLLPLLVSLAGWALLGGGWAPSGPFDRALALAAPGPCPGRGPPSGGRRSF